MAAIQLHRHTQVRKRVLSDLLFQIGWVSLCQRAGGSQGPVDDRHGWSAGMIRVRLGRRMVPRRWCRRIMHRDSLGMRERPVKQEQHQGPKMNRALTESQPRRRLQQEGVTMSLLCRSFWRGFFAYYFFLLIFIVDKVLCGQFGRLKRKPFFRCKVVLVIEYPEVKIAFSLFGKFFENTC